MAKYLYPAVFTKEEAGFAVNFPDLMNCFTSGETLEEAVEMAGDVLCLTLYGMEEEGAVPPAASAVNDVPHGENEFVSLISCDTIAYRRFFDNKAVKKNAFHSKLAERYGRTCRYQLFRHVTGSPESKTEHRMI